MLNGSTVRIATRASELALWQSRHVAMLLGARHPGLRVELVPMTTTGDRMLDRPLAAIGGKGLFIKELEQALTDGRADLAVHSMKDVPFELPAGLHVAAILAREDARDVLVSSDGRPLAALAPRARVGTSSLRRRSQLARLRPDLVLEDLRGNVPTRLQRLAAGRFDAIVLAAAGLIRLGLFGAGCRTFATDELLPAVGQGAIGIECRSDAHELNGLIEALTDPVTSACVRAERAMNARLGGSCQVPIAGHARVTGDTLILTGLVADVDGVECVRHTAHGACAEPERIGAELGDALLAAGAERILRRLNDA